MQRLVAEKENHPKDDLISDAIKQQVGAMYLMRIGVHTACASCGTTVQC